MSGLAATKAFNGVWRGQCVCGCEAIGRLYMGMYVAVWQLRIFHAVHSLQKADIPYLEGSTPAE